MKSKVTRGGITVHPEGARGYSSSNPYPDYQGKYYKRSFSSAYHSHGMTQGDAKTPYETKVDKKVESPTKCVVSSSKLCSETPSSVRDLQDGYARSEVPAHHDSPASSILGSEQKILREDQEDNGWEDLHSSHLTALSQSQTTSNISQPSADHAHTNERPPLAVTCKCSNSSSSQLQNIVTDSCDDPYDLPSTRSKSQSLSEERSASSSDHRVATVEVGDLVLINSSSNPTSLALDLRCSGDWESETPSAVSQISANDFAYASITHNMSSTPEDLGDALKRLFDESQYSILSGTKAESRSSNASKLELENALNVRSLRHLQQKFGELTLFENANTIKHPKATGAKIIAEGLDKFEIPFLSNFQSQVLPPGQSWGIKRTTQRLTESIHSQCQAGDGLFREHTLSSGQKSYSDSTLARSENEITQAGRNSTQSPRSGKKRKFSQNPSGEDSDEEGAPTETSKGKGKEIGPLFACPYFKRDTLQYGDRRYWPNCSGPGWPTVHRLK